MSIAKQLQAIIINVIFVFVLALILAAFFKKETHMYDTSVDNQSTFEQL